jgi:hypothetical protein
MMASNYKIIDSWDREVYKKNDEVESMSWSIVEENFLKRLLRLDEMMLNVNEADNVISKGRISC